MKRQVKGESSSNPESGQEPGVPIEHCNQTSVDLRPVRQTDPRAQMFADGERTCIRGEYTMFFMVLPEDKSNETREWVAY